MLAALFLLAATPTTAEAPILDRYYQCLVDNALDLEESRERSDLVARAVVHKCRPLFAEAAMVLRSDKASAARESALDPDRAEGFEDRFRAYSLDYALTLIVQMRARQHQ